MGFSRQEYWSGVPLPSPFYILSRLVINFYIMFKNFLKSLHAFILEKEMASHSSVLAWRIPGLGEPGGLPFMGLHRVGHN